MENYNMYLELANSEVRAMESYSNFQMFLDETIESAMESTGSFKESLVKMKDRIIKFFKMIFAAISRFFIKLFGKSERLGHKKAINIIKTYASVTKLRIYKIIEDIVKYLMKSNSSMDTMILPESINESHEDIKEQTQKVKDDIHDILNNNKDKHEYSLISKSDLSFIQNFTKDCENIIEKTLVALNNEQPNNSLQHKYLSILHTSLNKLLSTVSNITTTVTQLTQSAMWKGRVEDNETKLKNPVTIEVED